MKRAPIQNLVTGFNPDVPDLDLPPGGWTDSRNVQYRDGALEKCRGYEQALGALSVTAIWAAPISDGTTYFWCYGSQTVMYATDGATHADITGVLSLSAALDLGYTGGPFHGYMIVNDGVAVPQSWIPSLSNNLVSLTAFPAITCKVVRSWKEFLFALRITDGGVYNPRLMRWSDAAPFGALPSSWDYADPTNQAGIVEFGQTEDQLVDCLPLRDNLAIYKENHIWLGEYVGGADILGFRQVFSQTGAMTENCIATFGTSHVVLGSEDVILHDGNSARSLLDKRARRWMFSRIDATSYKRSFLSVDYGSRQIYICFPESGSTYPNLALVWNWAEDTLHPYDLGGSKTFGTHGIIGSTSGETFDAASGTIDSEGDPFDVEHFSPFDRKMVMLAADTPKLYQFDVGETYNGIAMSCYAERTGTAITEDLGTIKRVWRIWPKVIGTVGDALVFKIGAREALSGVVAYSGPYSFVIGTDNWIDVRFDARIIDLRVEYSGTATFRLYGMNVDYEDSGDR
jgi:hypothetical protein